VREEDRLGKEEKESIWEELFTKRPRLLQLNKKQSVIIVIRENKRSGERGRGGGSRGRISNTKMGNTTTKVKRRGEDSSGRKTVMYNDRVVPEDLVGEEPWSSLLKR